MGKCDSVENSHEKLSENNRSLNNGEDLTHYGSTDQQTLIPPANAKHVKYCRILSSLRIEPVMFLFMFSFILNTTCLTNLMMDKGCLYYLNYSKHICDNLHNKTFKNESDNVEILANTYNLYLNMLAPIGAFVVIFLAPWSDKHGRNPLLISALTGFLLNDIGIILCTIYFDSPLYFILISNLPTQISGGFISVMTCIYSHVSEVSTTELRSMKYTSLQISFGLAVTLGALVGGQLYNFFGYKCVFSTMAVGHVCAILWVVLFVPETRGLDVRVSLRRKIRDLTISQNFTDGLRTCIKFRENHGRFQLWLLLLSSCTIALTYEVYTNIAYVYTHHMYKWNPTIYSEYWAAFSFTEMIVFLVCSSVFIKVFKFSDPLIGIIGSVSIIGKNVFLAFAYELWLFYISNIFGFLNGMGNLAVRSLISKIVPENELGRVFSFLATCESIVPLLGSLVIAKIFNATIKIFPGACYLSATVFLLLPLGTFLYQFKKERSNLPKHETFSDKEF
ncbi:probable peptidoglycan muropeptide transporter SLC46 isoform X1 [Parasteatoda tepidariorum]|uniref:probable peptidoglycan muropeptide transporter SLC46 isoform X1 n=1 Tax=Parasteatoda tepidariorum TaxID=114398 RepID=UPI001C71CB47|nr:proton-coupled folate transporter isoform X2 [Parasteatoda tepidariorum]XP_042900407.1 proton-coupled folate transporter isoform X1 [Parasteatoda tepidariorum]XP_042900408.1 proton-coupled folate transporter isoform X1 [Parasteatoda tepidariorum]XP_042900409.1 proton-coupled folate transporter isoform X1 [Parasteatoda tepidariorum]XP_042900410.1 proton-coupled folate transporter isoform X1 [Parasteatoda tepidariorum]XP_042900412.1 proton-coupled folate transporter isoform X1 [Parasteatoda t